MFRWDLMLSEREPRCASVARFAKWERSFVAALLAMTARGTPSCSWSAMMTFQLYRRGQSQSFDNFFA
jgi:hypothetical protein